MSSRAKILAAVKANLPDSSPLPNLDDFNSAGKTDNLLDQFIAMAKAVSSEVRTIELEAIPNFIDESFPTGRRVTHSRYLASTSDLNTIDPHDLDDVEVATIDARFGVVENGAVWVDEHCLGQRALPFICQHLVIILEQNKLAGNMNDAYESIAADTMPSYGLFIGGPSKTADIEQALVLGAHGALSNTILLIP